MSRLRLLVISYELYNHTSVGNCARKIINALLHNDINITVLTRPVDENSRVLGNGCLVNNQCQHIYSPLNTNVLFKPYRWLKYSAPMVIRKFVSYIDNIFLRKYLFDFWSYKWCQNSVKLAENLEYDLLLSISVPQQSHEVAYQLKCKNKKPWVAYFSDPWPSFCNLPIHNWQSKPLNKNFANMLERHINKADLLAITNQRMSKQMALYFKDSWLHSKVHILPHIIDGYKSDVQTANMVLENSYAEGGCLNIVHAGTLSKMARGVYPLMFREFLEGFSKAIKKHNLDSNRIKLKFVGTLAEPDLDTYLKELELEQYFELIPRQNYKQTENILAKADILLVVETQSDNGIYLLSKITDYLSYEKPIAFISPLNGATRDILPMLKFVAEPGNVNAIFTMWDKLLTKWSQQQIVSEIISRQDVEHLSSEYIGKKLFNKIKGLKNVNI